MTVQPDHQVGGIFSWLRALSNSQGGTQLKSPLEEMTVKKCVLPIIIPLSFSHNSTNRYFQLALNYTAVLVFSLADLLWVFNHISNEICSCWNQFHQSLLVFFRSCNICAVNKGSYPARSARSARSARNAPLAVTLWIRFTL